MRGVKLRTLHECKFEICQASVDLWPRMKIKSTVKPQLSQGENCIIVPLCQSNNFPLDLELKIKHWTSTQTGAYQFCSYKSWEHWQKEFNIKQACLWGFILYFLLSRFIYITTVIILLTCILYNKITNLDISFWFGYAAVEIHIVKVDFHCRNTAGTQSLKWSASAFSVIMWQQNCKYSS